MQPSIHKGSDERVLRTSVGDLPLNEYLLNANGREWKVLHVNAVLSRDEENEYLLSPDDRLPYGITLWAASIALAHDVALRGGFASANVLELGAGTGLPGIVAASNGARVVQTDNNDVALYLARLNLARNGLTAAVEQRSVDWADWDDPGKYDWILGSDILYSAAMHPHLRGIFESGLVAGGKVLLSDPFRATSLKLLEELEKEGWSVAISKWSIGDGPSARPIGIFELAPPGGAA